MYFCKSFKLLTQRSDEFGTCNRSKNLENFLTTLLVFLAVTFFLFIVIIIIASIIILYLLFTTLFRLFSREI